MTKILLITSLLFIGCTQKLKIEPEVVKDKNTTIVYSLDRNYSVSFPEASALDDSRSSVENKSMLNLFYKVKGLILRLKKRDAIIESYEDKQCQ